MNQIKVSLPDDVRALLDEWASDGNRSSSSLAAYLIERALSEAIERGDFTPKKKGQKENTK